MPSIRDLQSSGDKWSRVVQTRAQDYADGVANPRVDWKTATAAASAAYQTGVQQALTAKSWDKGIARVGTSGWQAATMAKGPGRWQQGIALGVDAYTQGFAPFHAAIKSTALPVRGPAGSAANYDRARIMGEALHKVKLARP
jgi:hypothetical protein